MEWNSIKSRLSAEQINHRHAVIDVSGCRGGHGGHAGHVQPLLSHLRRRIAVSTSIVGPSRFVCLLRCSTHRAAEIRSA